MLFKWFIGGAILGFLWGIFEGGGINNALGTAVFVGILAVAFRRWVFRTFWG